MKVPNPVLTAAAALALGDPGTDANGSPIPDSVGQANAEAECSRDGSDLYNAQREAGTDKPADMSGEDNAGNGDVDAAIRHHNERIKALRGNQETSVADRLRADTRPRPSVGRTVHFMPRHIEGNDKPGFVPAIITRVLDDETVNLRVFTDDGHDSVPHASNVPAGWSIRKTDDATQGYYWAWPERV